MSAVPRAPRRRELQNLAKGKRGSAARSIALSPPLWEAVASLDERGLIKCPLLPPLRTHVGHRPRSEKCHSGTPALQRRCLLAHAVKQTGGACRPTGEPRQAPPW